MQAAGQWILIFIISLSLFALGPVKPSAALICPGLICPGLICPHPARRSPNSNRRSYGCWPPNACPSPPDAPQGSG